MATTKAQRIGIWIIAVFMAVGTIGSFVIIVLANQNSQTDQARYNELYSQYQASIEKRNKDNFDILNKQASLVGSFNAKSVKKLEKKDITTGDGETLASDSSFTAYYIGWTPDGKIFDSSIDGDTLKNPIDVTPGGVIEGWTKGVEGMKVGGMRELTIPSDLAYGETGSGDSIPANTPLKFIVLTVPAVEAPQELLTLYGRLYGN
jgi:FKBP-type peptidyl-prolyl cis-trans isomerase FkpA